MLSEPTYLAARIVASTIESHFADHIEAAQRLGVKNLAVKPPAYVIEAVIDTAFWASLRREEGHSPKISIALLPPEAAGTPMIFEQRLRFTPHNLVKLAPAVERAGIHLGVWYEDDTLYVWGTTHVIPGICFVCEVIEPGLLVIKHRRTDGFGKFVNIAILKGDEIKIVDEISSSLTDCPALLTSLLGMPLPSFLDDSVNVLVELAASMRAHGRGGIVLIVPAQSSTWRASVIHPVSYPVVPAYCGLADLIRMDTNERTKPYWQDALRRAIDLVGGFTAVDGATVINTEHELLAFGAKITRATGGAQVEQIIMTEPIVDSTPVMMHPAQNGGTRHMAAAQFVYDQRAGQAMVASQDGHFTVFAWSDELQMVHAHRIDSLLL